MSTAQFRSGALVVINVSANALHKVGVRDKVTMRNFDASRLTVPPARRIIGGFAVVDCNPGVSQKLSRSR